MQRERAAGQRQKPLELTALRPRGPGLLLLQSFRARHYLHRAGLLDCAASVDTSSSEAGFLI
ncbi:hypothetical protein GHK68_14210 [Sinorhizobium meliloti]|uniref:hypothetical protein n=1 Tax=Rhizobium meliloti TaxID=382 RepID=UPI001294DFEE|nr:hypothetical protein [Sinorhizobium meliloti]MQW41699.1 hypothetical protein [Sinorhizobium meliloti]MQW43412.1 hypothetical protein [Sinorhizobium meliloti]